MKTEIIAKERYVYYVVRVYGANLEPTGYLAQYTKVSTTLQSATHFYSREFADQAADAAGVDYYTVHRIVVTINCEK